MRTIKYNEALNSNGTVDVPVLSVGGLWAMFYNPTTGQLYVEKQTNR